MRSFFKGILSLTIAMVIASACNKDQTISYNATAIGNIVAGTFVADGGTKYIVTEQTCQEKLDTMSRALIVCDILSKESDQEYKIRLKSANSVTMCPILRSGSIDDMEEIGNDPVNMFQGWISGGYLNTVLQHTMKKGSKTAHSFSIFVDEKRSNDETLYLELRHNGHGDVFTEKSSDDTSFILNFKHYSFDISGLIPEGKTEIKFVLGYQWHDEVGGSLFPTTQRVETPGVLK